MNSIKKGIKRFVNDLNLLVNFILLFFVYFFGVGITFVFAKLFRKKFLYLRKKESYWSDLDSREVKMEDFYSQF